MIKNPACKAGEHGFDACRGTKIPHAVRQLNPCTSTRKSTCHKLQSPCTLEPMAATTEPVYHN